MLYHYYGNKEALFRAALDRYENFRDQIMEEAFAAPTAREAMTRLLEGTADRLSDKDKPKSRARSPGVRNARRSNTTSPRAAPAARCSSASA